MSSASSRRETRLRRSYLYAKSQSASLATAKRKIEKLEHAVSKRGKIATEMRSDYDELKNKGDHLDDFTSKSELDDEYANTGLVNPKICFCTSREPSSRLKQFVKEMALVFNGVRINRGSTTINDLIDSCKSNAFTDVVIMHETRGMPDGFTLNHLPIGPTFYFGIDKKSVVMRHDIPNVGSMSEAVPHLILENFATQLGGRVKDCLRALFPVRHETKNNANTGRVITFCNNHDTIQFRNHTYVKTGDRDISKVALRECGPRFNFSLYRIKLGNIHEEEADDEWRFNNFVNSRGANNSL